MFYQSMMRLHSLKQHNMKTTLLYLTIIIYVINI